MDQFSSLILYSKLVLALGASFVLVPQSSGQGRQLDEANTSANWIRHDVLKQAGSAINSAVAADFNRDGQMDVVASYQRKVFLLVGPDWKPVQIHAFRNEDSRNQPGPACIHSCLIDVDGDGDLDVIGSNQTLFWLECPEEADSGRSWNYRTIDDEMLGSHCVVAGDVDQDGQLDLIANSFQGKDRTPVPQSIAWLKIPSQPRKAKNWIRNVFADQDAPGGSHYMGLGDLNADGRPDIACGAKGDPFEHGNWFAWWEQPPQPGGPWKKHLFAENQTGATNILPTDVDGDGVMDLVATRGHGMGVLWFQGPDWQPHEIDAEMLGPHTLVVDDFDGDGDPDLATVGRDLDAVGRWYRNDGDGKFTAEVFVQNQGSYDLRAVDMDGDGDLDLLNAGHFNRNIQWYENRTRR